MKSGSKPPLEVSDQAQRRADSMGMIDLDGLTRSYRNTLWIVTAITGSMFLFEAAAGHMYGSHVLQADALDFLDDTLTYALSLAAIGASMRMRAAAALLKATFLCLMSLWVIGSSIYHLFVFDLPRAEIMGTVGLLAIIANTACLAFLAPHTGRDAHIRADGVNFRHDIAGNVAVIITAVAVWALQSPWLDLLIAIVATGRWSTTAIRMLRQAVGVYRASGNSTTS